MRLREDVGVTEAVPQSMAKHPYMLTLTEAAKGALRLLVHPVCSWYG